MVSVNEQLTDLIGTLDRFRVLLPAVEKAGRAIRSALAAEQEIQILHDVL
jgi:hypothetical protein